MIASFSVTLDSSGCMGTEIVRVNPRFNQTFVERRSLLPNLLLFDSDRFPKRNLCLSSIESLLGLSIRSPRPFGAPQHSTPWSHSTQIGNHKVGAKSSSYTNSNHVMRASRLRPCDQQCITCTIAYTGSVAYLLPNHSVTWHQ